MELTDSSGHDKGTSPRITNLKFVLTGFHWQVLVMSPLLLFFVYLPVTCVTDVENFS